MARDPAAIVSDAESAARNAKAVLEQPGLVRAFASVEAHYLALIRNSDPARGRDDREAAFMMLRALDALRADLASTAAGGAIAARNHRSSLQRTRRS